MTLQRFDEEISTEDALEVLGRQAMEPLEDGTPMVEFGQFLIDAAQEMREMRKQISDLSWQINADRQGGA